MAFSLQTVMEREAAIRLQAFKQRLSGGDGVDWRAYFLAFMEVHGKNPVEVNGKLLFPDGWQYSRNNHAGPEYPPPADPDQHRGLRIVYWKKRREIVETQAPELRRYCD